MTVEKAIERADELRPNPFEQTEKQKWLYELDSKLAMELLGKSHMVCSYVSQPQAQLLVCEGYSDIYLFYLCSMIDFFSRDYEEYSNSSLVFNELYLSVKKAYKEGADVIGLPPEKSGSGCCHKNIF